MPKAPLPVRDGLNPSRVRLPESGHWPTTLEYLLQRFVGDETRLLEKITAAEVVDEGGRPIGADTPFVADSFVFLYRDPAPERRVPFEIDVLYRDENLLVIDKPHFLATTPRGDYIVESAVVRLRRRFDLPNLSPLHRLDRVTAGVVVFSLNPGQRGAYQNLFAHRQVSKSYWAVARPEPELQFPLTVSSRIIKERGTPTAQEVPGEPNSLTHVEQLAIRRNRALYELRPTTGKTHQLRVHMTTLGIPIMNDHFYPRLLEVDAHDYSHPLQLLARTVEFVDPFTGRPHLFASRRVLECWPDRPALTEIARNP